MEQVTHLKVSFVNFLFSNKKHRLNKTLLDLNCPLILMVLLFSIQSNIAFGTTINLEKYIGGYNAELAGKPALTFRFSSENSDNFCNIITTEEHMFSSNNLLENINLSEKNFYLDCEVEGQFYMLSNRYRTYAQVLIKQPDITFPMSMHIEAKLVTINGDQLNVISGDISLRK